MNLRIIVSLLLVSQIPLLRLAAAFGRMVMRHQLAHTQTFALAATFFGGICDETQIFRNFLFASPSKQVIRKKAVFLRLKEARPFVAVERILELFFHFDPDF